ncbi:response regulator [Croceitalea sp. MTPC9]|uniref:response regulator n=1 Tax=unclassified Croceitalea TaxID=2632280 RepID=UPI002B39720C|nr:response regulator [Croceitalea sp. MTPC6]GMN15951.1 response regulator [Croceitalea sp. MTPC9]
MHKTLTIWVIDDDDIFQFGMRINLKSLKIEKKVLFFKNGKEAADFMIENIKDETNLPDVIFLDINMPIMDGFEFMENFAQLKSKLKKRITIYMISSSIDPVDLKKAQAIKEISNYLVKPINLKELNKLILQHEQKD